MTLGFTALMEGWNLDIIQNFLIGFLNFQLKFLFLIVHQSEAFNGGIETNCHGGTRTDTFPDACL